MRIETANAIVEYSFIYLTPDIISLKGTFCYATEDIHHFHIRNICRALSKEKAVDIIYNELMRVDCLGLQNHPIKDVTYLKTSSLNPFEDAIKEKVSCFFSQKEIPTRSSYYFDFVDVFIEQMYPSPPEVDELMYESLGNNTFRRSTFSIDKEFRLEMSYDLYCSRWIDMDGNTIFDEEQFDWEIDTLMSEFKKEFPRHVLSDTGDEKETKLNLLTVAATMCYRALEDTQVWNEVGANDAKIPEGVVSFDTEQQPFSFNMYQTAKRCARCVVNRGL